MKNFENPSQNNQELERLVFSRTQVGRQKTGESSEQLHERLRPEILNSFQLIEKPTIIRTPSWYTFDLNQIGIPEGVAICTSTCKHETPYQILVGRRKDQFIQTTKTPLGDIYEYEVFPLGRELTVAEKNSIYDLM